jgi:hypothetical protein
MTIEAQLDRIIELLEAAGSSTCAVEKKPGRPPKDPVPAATSVVEPATTVTASPVTGTSPTQVGTMEAMRAAVLAYRDATNQETALKCLTDVGADNFTKVPPNLYQQVTDAAIAALAALTPAAPPTVAEDPFALPGSPDKAASLTLADVRAAFLKAQKTAGDKPLMALLAELGATAPGANGVAAPSLKALDPSKFQLAIDKLAALPKTK